MIAQRTKTKALAALLLAVAPVACGSETQEDVRTRIEQERREMEEHAWRQKQVIQDCPVGPYDERAMGLVLKAWRKPSSVYVYGPPDPYHRRADTLSHLKTRPNPRGEGIIVTAWKDENRLRNADFHRARAAWLVLGKNVYPVNNIAANDLGLMYDGMPSRVQKRAGLVHTYERGKTMMDQLGLEDHTFKREFSGSNPFPMCD